MIDKDQRCKGCGAPIRGRTCEYCGRVFEAEHTTETVLYANNIPIGVEKLSSTLDCLQYQVSQERQIAFLKKHHESYEQRISASTSDCKSDGDRMGEMAAEMPMR